MGGMTRMHFEEVARVLNTEYNRYHDPETPVAWEQGFESAIWRTMSRLATVFEDFNPAFDREKFMNACTKGRV